MRPVFEPPPSRELKDGSGIGGAIFIDREEENTLLTCVEARTSPCTRDVERRVPQERSSILPSEIGVEEGVSGREHEDVP